MLEPWQIVVSILLNRLESELPDLDFLWSFIRSILSFA